jgi:hypothetical protein
VTVVRKIGATYFANHVISLIGNVGFVASHCYQTLSRMRSGYEIGDEVVCKG